MTDLERALLELDVEWPKTPDLAAAVTTRVAPAGSDPPSRRARRLPAFSAGWRSRLAYVAVALVVLAAGTLTVSPDARSTVLRWLGLSSVEIERGPVPRDFGRDLNLGEPVAVPDDAPAPEALGEPDAAFATPLPDGTQVTSLVYAGPPRVLIQRFTATVTPFIEKTVGSADAVQRLTIDGAPAYFIRGSHGFAFQGPNGVAYEERRLADRVLLVERDGFLYRVEGMLSRERATEIYRSIE